MNTFDQNILIYSENICKNIANTDAQERGLLSQNILSNLRNLVEAIAQRIYSDFEAITLNKYDDIVKSLNYIATRGDLYFLIQFHNMLQSSASHFMPDEDNSIRLMLKYHEWLIKIKDYAKAIFGLSILGNLEDYPWEQDNSLIEYYQKIALSVDKCRYTHSEPADRFYVQKSKPFFVDGKIYYELTLTSADDFSGKFDRFTAFSNREIPTYYSIKLKFISSTIHVLNREMPISIIDSYRVAIRPIELEDLASILNIQKISTGTKEYHALMNFLTESGLSIVNIIDMVSPYYERLKMELQRDDMRSDNVVKTLDKCREISCKKIQGYITLRYLLLRLRHKVLKEQISDSPNNWFNNLKLKNSCLPFEKMPFYASLIRHNPSFHDIFACVNSHGREYELLARKIRVNSDQNVRLFNPVSDFEVLGDVSKLVAEYNSLLPEKQSDERKLVLDGKYIYINGYVNHALNVIKKLLNSIGTGLNGYVNSIDTWLESGNVDCDEKKVILRKMFAKSNIAIIFGAAGTGKTTLIKHISNYFAAAKKLFLANTNPAKDNLQRQIKVGNSDFSTIASSKKYINNYEYDIVVIDECSTVDNRTMDDLLQNISFKLLILVGDVYQIQSVEFGNWFSLTRYFMPSSVLYELTTPYRAHNSDLKYLWDKVRSLDDKIAEYLYHKKYSFNFGESLFHRDDKDEVLLCLNYDGLYGINNLNRFLQNDNANPPFRWENQVYKVDDPVIFSENNRFYPTIYNNLKGWIRKIEQEPSKIVFEIEIAIPLNSLEIYNPDLELLDCDVKGHSLIRFSVNHFVDDDTNERSENETVPFQVAYAISIHKAQGLEYNSVKVVISNQVDELISHSIFYTAITRARYSLKIFWTPETQQTVLDSIIPISNKQDACIIAGKFGLKLLNQVK